MPLQCRAAVFCAFSTAAEPGARARRRVTINGRNGKAKVMLEYSSLEDVNLIVEALDGS